MSYILFVTISVHSWLKRYNSYYIFPATFLVFIILSSCGKFVVERLSPVEIINTKFGAGVGEIGGVFINGHWQGIPMEIERGRRSIYVVDNYNRKISVFSMRGKFKFSIEHLKGIKEVGKIIESDRRVYIECVDKRTGMHKDLEKESKIFFYDTGTDSLKPYLNRTFTNVYRIQRTRKFEDLMVATLKESIGNVFIIRDGIIEKNIELSQLKGVGDKGFLFELFLDFNLRFTVYIVAVLDSGSGEIQELNIFRYNLKEENSDFLFSRRLSDGDIVNFSQFNHFMVWRGLKDNTALIKILNLKGRTIARKLINFNKVPPFLVKVSLLGLEEIYAIAINNNSFKVLKFN